VAGDIEDFYTVMPPLNSMLELTPQLAVERAYFSLSQSTAAKADSQKEPLFTNLNIEIKDKSGDLRTRSVAVNVVEEICPDTIAAKMATQLDLAPVVQSDIASQVRQQVMKMGIPTIEAHKRRSQGGETQLDNCRRILLKVEVENEQGKPQLLTDQFDWDLCNPHNNPEMFAQALCADLGLSFKNVQRIANALRAELLRLEEDIAENTGKNIVGGLRVLSEEDKKMLKDDCKRFMQNIVDGIVDHAYERYQFELDMQPNEEERANYREQKRVARKWRELNLGSNFDATLLGKGRKPARFIRKPFRSAPHVDSIDREKTSKAEGSRGHVDCKFTRVHTMSRPIIADEFFLT